MLQSTRKGFCIAFIVKLEIFTNLEITQKMCKNLPLKFSLFWTWRLMLKRAGKTVDIFTALISLAEAGSQLLQTLSRFCTNSADFSVYSVLRPNAASLPLRRDNCRQFCKSGAFQGLRGAGGGGGGGRVYLRLRGGKIPLGIFLTRVGVGCFSRVGSTFYSF